SIFSCGSCVASSLIRLSYCKYATDNIGKKKAVKYKLWSIRKLRGLPLCTATVNITASIVISPKVLIILPRVSICCDNNSKDNAGSKSIAEIPASARWYSERRPPVSGTRVQASCATEDATIRTLNQSEILNSGT